MKTIKEFTKGNFDVKELLTTEELSEIMGGDVCWGGKCTAGACTMGACTMGTCTMGACTLGVLMVTPEDGNPDEGGN